MIDKPLIQHIALEYNEKSKADLFFCTVLGLPKVKSITLPKELSTTIFRIAAPVDIEIYGDDRARFEVFICNTKRHVTYEHVCLEVPDKDEFLTRCEKYGLKPFFVEKDGKQLLFVRDFAGYLFEIKRN